jgi:hypothetical protein
VERFGSLFNVSVFDLVTLLLGVLFGAPEGYEDENGFHFGALADAVPL